MSKGYKMLLIGLILLLSLVIFLEAGAPDPVDWRKTYSTEDKIPFGTYIFFKTLEEQANELQIIPKQPLEFIEDSTVYGTYMFMYEGVNFSESAQEKFLKWVEKVNTLVLSAEYSHIFDNDSLHLRFKYDIKGNDIINYPVFNFYNPELKNAEDFVFERDATLSYFNEIDSLNHLVLGWNNFKNANQLLEPNEINFLKIPYGKGELLFHSSPQVFSNFFLLKNKNYEYLEKLFAYLDLENTIYYDVYLDPNFNWKMFYSSPLYVILLNKYLKWGYYFLIIGAVLFILFEGKRKQKAIPVIPPLQNKSYEYIRSIAGLYLEQKNHAAIAHKKIEQFLDYIREHLRVAVKTIDQELINQLDELTEVSREEISQLFEEIRVLQEKSTVSKKELQSLNRRINRFKKNN